MSQSIASTYDEYGRSGVKPVKYFGSVARSDTTAKELFRLSAGDIPIGLKVQPMGAASDAGTNARISVGSTSNVAYFLAGFDVKGTTLTGGGLQSVPSSAANLYVPLAFDTIVEATYAEAGTASTSGGPWIIEFEVLRDV